MQYFIPFLSQSHMTDSLTWDFDPLTFLSKYSVYKKDPNSQKG